MLSRGLRLENDLFFLAGEVGLIEVELPQPVEVRKGSFHSRLVFFVTDGLEYFLTTLKETPESELQAMSLQVLQRLL